SRAASASTEAARSATKVSQTSSRETSPVSIALLESTAGAGAVDAATVAGGATCRVGSAVLSVTSAAIVTSAIAAREVAGTRLPRNRRANRITMFDDGGCASAATASCTRRVN